MRAAVAALRAVMLLAIISHLPYLVGACGYCSRVLSDAACHRHSVTSHIWQVRAAIAALRAAMLLAIISQ